MKQFFFLTFFLISSYFFSQQQQVLQSHQIYFDHNIAYRHFDVTVFSGIAEFRENKGILTRREVYENGIMTKKITYYTTNVPKGKEVPYQEIDYADRKMITKTSYRVTGEKYYYVEYKDDGAPEYSEQWRDGQLSAIQYFRNGKLDGKSFVMDTDGKWTEEYYRNGEFLRRKPLESELPEPKSTTPETSKNSSNAETVKAP